MNSTAQTSQNERKRIQDQSDLDRKVFEDALSQLASVLETEPSESETILSDDGDAAEPFALKEELSSRSLHLTAATARLAKGR